MTIIAAEALYQVRNPYDWLLSMWKSPWNAPLHKGLRFGNFLTKVPRGKEIRFTTRVELLLDMYAIFFYSDHVGSYGESLVHGLYMFVQGRAPSFCLYFHNNANMPSYLFINIVFENFM